MRWFLLSFISFNCLASIKAEGFLQKENNQIWLKKGYDVTQVLPDVPACSSKDLTQYLGLYVQVTWQVSAKTKCFDVSSVEPAIYDPLRGGLKKYKKP